MGCHRSIASQARGLLFVCGALLMVGSGAAEDRILVEVELPKPAPAPPQKQLFEKQDWYINQPPKQPQQFTGTLARLAAPQATTGRFNPYRLQMKDKVLEVYVGGTPEIINAYVGKRVTITGKPVEISVAGQTHHEIWPGSIALAPDEAKDGNRADGNAADNPAANKTANGLAVSIEPTQPEFGREELPTFNVTWKNVTGEPMQLVLYSGIFGKRIYDWSWEVEDQARKLRYGCAPNPRAFAVGAPTQMTVATLAAGESDSTFFKLPGIGMLFRVQKEFPLGDDRPQAPAELGDGTHLPPGRYRLTLTIEAGPNPPAGQPKLYAGKVSRTVDFTIAEK